MLQYYITMQLPQARYYRYNRLICDNSAPYEKLQHERATPKVNLWQELKAIKQMVRLSSHIITKSNSYVHMLKNYASPQMKNMLKSFSWNLTPPTPQYLGNALGQSLTPQIENK
jgi:hypothetical protein